MNHWLLQTPHGDEQPKPTEKKLTPLTDRAQTSQGQVSCCARNSSSQRKKLRCLCKGPLSVCSQGCRIVDITSRVCNESTLTQCRRSRKSPLPLPARLSLGSRTPSDRQYHPHGQSHCPCRPGLRTECLGRGHCCSFPKRSHF